YETANMVKQFILQYARYMDYHPHNSEPITVYNEYINNIHLTSSQSKNISYDTFRNLWYQLTPNIKFQSAATDLCDTCEAFRQPLKNVDSDNEDENINFDFKQHLDVADIER